MSDAPFNPSLATAALRETVGKAYDGGNMEWSDASMAMRRYVRDMRSHMKDWTIARRARADIYLGKLDDEIPRFEQDRDEVRQRVVDVMRELDGIEEGLAQAEERKDWDE
jgi:hypothetical protein